ncbi:MAG: hypothetical protein ACK5JF_03880 [Oscillospiraceae bacterium]
MGKQFAIIGGASREIKRKLAIVDGASRETKNEFAIIDGAARNVFKRAVTISVSNAGYAAGTNQKTWSDAASVTEYVAAAPAITGRVWLYIYYGGWSYGDAYAKARRGPFESDLTGETNLNGSTAGKFGTYNNILTINGTAPHVIIRRAGASQGSGGIYARVMCVKLDAVDAAMGRQITLAECRSIIGYNWTGSKSITIEP